MLDKTANNTIYQGGEGQSVFPIPFPFLENSHISAVIRDGDGVRRVLAPGVDYIINGISDANGELVLLGGDLPAGSRLAISRRVPLTQDILFHNQGPNSPRAVEEAVDKLTMIAQQLQDDVDHRLPVPEDTTAEELTETLAALGSFDDLHSGVRSLEAQVQSKAELNHGHTPDQVNGLAGLLADKADAQAVAAALAGKVDLDDPRLSGIGAGAPAVHVSAHAVGGSDPLTAAAIGALAPPPADGKPYLAANGGWIEYVAPSGGGTEEGVGTLDHSQLLNRDAADQHPQSAVQHLTRDLAELRGGIGGLESSLAAKADKSQLPAAATQSAAGLMSAGDKAKLDGLPASVESLPAGGAVNAVLARDAANGSTWKTPTQLADTLPWMSASQFGVAKLLSGGGLKLDAQGRLGFSGTPADKSYVDGQLSTLSARLDALEANGSGSGDGAAAMVGEIRLLPWRRADLPGGWYFCNGDRYNLSTAQGAALNSLSAAYKTDWAITVSGSTINLPSLFKGSDGYFLRAVDNSARRPGGAQDDAIRNITGGMNLANTSGLTINGSAHGTTTFTGAFTTSAFTKKYFMSTVHNGTDQVGDLAFDASGSVPTAEENRPINIGMTPAIYLGV